MGKLLLEIEVNPCNSNVFVADRAFMECTRRLYQGKSGLPEKYVLDSQALGERRYMESRVLLTEYLARQDELGYSLPEVIVTKMVPFERVLISGEQPLLEQELEKLKGFPREGKLVRNIQQIPELGSWYNQYRDVSDRELKVEFSNLG